MSEYLSNILFLLILAALVGAWLFGLFDSGEKQHYYVEYCNDFKTSVNVCPDKNLVVGKVNYRVLIDKQQIIFKAAGGIAESCEIYDYKNFTCEAWFMMDGKVTHNNPKLTELQISKFEYYLFKLRKLFK